MPGKDKKCKILSAKNQDQKLKQNKQIKSAKRKS